MRRPAETSARRGSIRINHVFSNRSNRWNICSNYQTNLMKHYLCIILSIVARVAKYCIAIVFFPAINK